ncbi:S49 family peptidase [Tessaracoccus sp. MC1679]|uniref:S49 family peptidase n=1 Tax=Tessaracoccus sp. MC1679 TaxID=2760313 RepID=UPI0016025020|nr:S49 family peptidase [Tessaracoccus sp. MC1679]
MSDPSQSFPPPSVEQRSADLPQPASPPKPPEPQPPRQPAGPQFAPAPKQPSGFGRGFGIGAGIGLGLGAASLLMAVVLGAMTIIGSLTLVSTASGVATTQLATIWGDGSQSLRAIPVSGPIMADASDGALLSAGSYGYEIASQLDELTVDDAAGVVLLVNTPGGSIAGSRAVSDAVVRYQERTGQKVLVHVSSISASGGVYATAPADEIIVDHGALVGSIGVIFGPFDQYTDVIATSGTLFESGVTTTGGITSEYLSQGEGKDFGNPFRPMTDEERAIYTAGLATEYDAFVAHVAQHRDITESAIRDQIGAHLYDSERAQEYGLIDGVLGRDEFFRHAAEAAGLDPEDTRVEAVRQPSSWEVFLGVERPFGAAPAVLTGEGIVPALSPALCRPSQPLALAGSLEVYCG